MTKPIYPLPTLSEGVATAFGLANAPALESMARSALSSELLQRATIREHWQELTLSVPHRGKLLEGIIDLLFRNDDGTLTMVDFKTDIYVTSERLNSYWTQLRHYADAVEQATGEQVRTAKLLFCRPEATQELTRDLIKLSI